MSCTPIGSPVSLIPGEGTDIAGWPVWFQIGVKG